MVREGIDLSTVFFNFGPGPVGKNTSTRLKRIPCNRSRCQVWTLFVENQRRYSSSKSVNFTDFCTMGSKSASPHTPLSPPPPPTSPYTPLCGKFPNFKALFPAVSMEIHELVLSKTLKKKRGRVHCECKRSSMWRGQWVGKNVTSPIERERKRDPVPARNP